MKESFLHYRTVEDGYRRKVFILSILLTLIIFLILPFFDRLVGLKKNVALRKITSTTVLRDMPDPPPKLKKQKKTKSMPPKLLSERKKLTALKINADLDFTYQTGAADIALDFSVLQDISEQDFIFELDQVDTPPQAVYRIEPLYPVHAKMRAIQGNVVLLFVVTEKGKVRDIRVKTSDPEGVFERAAISAVEKWRFKPAVKNEVPVSVNVSLPLKFQVHR